MASFRLSKFDTIDWEGLEVVPHADFAGLQIAPDPRYGNEKEVNIDAEGLQKSQRSLGGDEGNEKEVVNGFFRMLHIPAATSPAQKRFRWLLASLMCIVLVVAVVLGIVFGNKHSSPPASLGSAGNPDSTDPTTPIAPNQGSWKGTGIAAAQVSQSSGDGIEIHGCWFQDYTGRLQAIYFDRVPLVSFRAVSLNITAAKGTPITAYTRGVPGSAQLDNQEETQLIYVAPNGTLVDILISDIASGAFRPGTLSLMQFAVPTDARVAMHLLQNPDQRSRTLYIGGVDGRIHSHFYNGDKYIWLAGAAIDLPNSWSYGRVFAWDDALTAPPNETGEAERNLFMSDESGSIIHYTQTNNWSSYTQWGSWMENPTNIDGIVRNASMTGTLQKTYGTTEHQETLSKWALYRDSSGNITAQNVYNTTVSNEASQFIISANLGPQVSGIARRPMMPGSDMLVLQDSNLLFYQSQNDSLDWLVFETSADDTSNDPSLDTNISASGQFVSNGTDSNGNTIWHVVVDAS